MKAPLAVLCTGLALSWVAVVGAQGYGQSGSQASDQGMSRSQKSSEVKLIGCLAQGTSSGEYVLNNVQAESGKHGKNKSNAGQTGTSGTSGMSGEQGEQTNMSFDLVPGSKRVDLSKYVGQKVEIRGRVEPEQGGSSGMSSQGASGGMSGETGTSGQSGSMSGGSMSGQSGSQSGSMSGQSGSMSGQSSTGAVTHKVRVSSVKQLGSSCQ